MVNYVKDITAQCVREQLITKEIYYTTYMASEERLKKETNGSSGSVISDESLTECNITTTPQLWQKLNPAKGKGGVKIPEFILWWSPGPDVTNGQAY